MIIAQACSPSGDISAAVILVAFFVFCGFVAWRCT